jgi:prevent-host-death family protein
MVKKLQPGDSTTPASLRHAHSARISAGEFKTHCLRLMDEVSATRAELVITKRGRPIARLIPVDEGLTDPFGTLRGSVVLHGDIVAPDHDSWDEPDR